MAAAAEDDAEVGMLPSPLFRRGFWAREDCAEAEEGEDEDGGGGGGEEEEEENCVHGERFASCVIGGSLFPGSRSGYGS